MDDPLRVAEDEARDDEPRPPNEHCSSSDIGTRRPPAEPERSDEEEQGGGEEPGDLRPHLRAEQPADAGRPPAARLSRDTAVDDAAGLVAGETAEAVVAEDQLEDAVVLRAADVRPARGGPEGHDRNPPSGRDDERDACAEQLNHAPPQRGGRGEQIDERKPGDDDQRLQHLRQEAEPDQRGRQEEPGRPCAFDRARQCVPGPDQHECEQRVRIVESEDQHGDRRQREDAAGEQACSGAEPALDRRVQQRDRGHAFERLRHEDAPGVDPEQPRRDVHHPQ